MKLENIDISTVFTIAGTVCTGVGGFYMTVRKLIIAREKAAKARDNSIIQQAKENDLILKEDIEQKLREMSLKLEDQKEDFETEIRHLKETHNSELKYLGEKIEELRSEVQNHHMQLMQLLTRMISKD